MRVFFFLLEKIIIILKIGSYGFLAVLLYTEFLGPEEFAKKWLEINDVSEHGKIQGALIVSGTIIKVSIFLAVLELMSNFLDFFRNRKLKE